jgi:hypothetical protein
MPFSARSVPGPLDTDGSYPSAHGPTRRLASQETVASSAMSGPSIFISYAHEDADLARELAQALRRRKCRVWIDEGEMRGR